MSRTDGVSSTLTRRDALALPLVLGAGALTSRLAHSESPRRGGVLRVVTYANPSSLDPATGRSGTDHTYLWPMFDTLVDFEHATLSPRPGLAESWEYRDQTTLVLSLRKDVVFHDGTPFDADAVKANFDHMLGDPRSTVKGDVSTIKSVEVETPLRVVVRLKAPDTSLPLAMSDRIGMMSSPKAFGALGAAYDRKPVGTGAYEFVEWIDGDKVVLKRNARYWKSGAPFMDGLEFKVMIDANTGLRSVMSGQADFMFRVPPHQAPIVRRDKNFVFLTGPTLYCQLIYLNCSRPPLDDKRIRQALNLAIDREAYTKVVTAGLGEPAYTVIPKHHWAYDAQASAMYHYDVDRARKLMADAGFAGGLELMSNTASDPFTTQRMEIIAAQLGKIGIKLKYTVGTLAQSNQTWNDGIGDIRLTAWTGRPDPSITFASLYSPEGFFNRGGAEPSKDLTQAIKDTRATTDIDLRKQAFARAARLEREFAMSLPLAFESEVVAHHVRVKGYVPNLIGKPRFDGVYLDSA
jgi:ABC-type transport system substrate-binding protein